MPLLLCLLVLCPLVFINSPPHLLSHPLFNVTSQGIHLTAFNLNDSTWPSDLILDLSKSNWVEWSRKLTLLALRHGFEPWLDGSLPCPDSTSSPHAAYIWKSNDADLRGFIRDRVSAAETHLVDHLSTGHLMFEALKAHHEQQGAFAQINILLKALQIEVSYETSIRDKVAEMRTAYQRILAMGPIQLDDIFSVILLNSMNKHMAPLQQHIHSLSSSPSFCSETIAKRLIDEDNLIHRRVEAGQPRNPYSLSSLPTASAFSATSNAARTPRPLCTNCKQDNHGTDYCIAPSGKMAGRSIEEAKAARQKARESLSSRPPRAQSSSTNVTSHSTLPSLGNQTLYVNGLPYVLDPSWHKPVPSSAHITELPSPSNDNSYEYRASLVLSDCFPDPPTSSLQSFSSAFSITLSPLVPSLPSSLPFILDSSATCHISPVLSDFLVLNPITPHPIKGLGNILVDAIGIGTIHLVGPSGSLSLTNAFYVPKSCVRLISAFLLDDYSSHFFPRQGHCYITDANNIIILRGTTLHDRKLFALSATSVPRPSSLSQPSHAYIASRLPDIDMWHRRLGHCAYDTIIKMACSGRVKNINIDHSSKPSKCVHCILGKQTRSPVPPLREGPQASEPLARIFIDLCGPMSLPSHSRCSYLMNIIDDYSSFVWSFPLHSKGDSATALKHWLIAQENQTPYRLKSFVTDNGELCSAQIRQWCQQKGILHLLTAPYTSAHNGRAERLHCTLMDRARAMRSQCNSPIDMWDEFCATAAYLTNFTCTTTNNDKTPYELWYEHEPSLNHIREIGCRAFALIPTHNPKINYRSSPCILIGYAPQSKAFHLWDHSNNRIFNSFHVSFIESFEQTPTPVHPVTTSSLSPSHPIPYFQLSTPYNPSPHFNNDLPLPHLTVNHPFSPASRSANPPIHQNTTASSTPIPADTYHPLSSPSVPPVSVVPPPNPTPHIMISPPSPSTNLPPHDNTVTSSARIPTDISAPSSSPSAANSLPQQPTLPQHSDSNNTSLKNNSTPSFPVLPPPPSSRIPVRRSLHIAAKSNPSNDQALSVSLRSPFSSSLPSPDPLHSAFLSEFSPLSHSHTLIPLCLSTDHELFSVADVLSALSSGTAETTLDDNDDPTWTAALKSPDREYWIAGAREELKSLEDLQVFVLVPHSGIPRGRHPLKGKLVCKRKRDDAGNVSRHKVRYVVKGFAQRYMINYDKTAAPTTRLESFRSILHIAAILDWDIQHVDIKTVFLHGILPESETVFMEQPPGFEVAGKHDWVMKLMKSLYGMKQASRIWNRTFHTALTSLGFTRLACEWCVYIQRSASATTIFAIHVDNIIFISSSPEESLLFKSQLRECWEISDLGSAKFALGITIDCD